MDDSLSRTRVVLVVERDQKVRELQRHFLERAGFVVEFAEDGRDAFARARAAPPAAVVAEILVPGMDGLTLCRHLAAEPATRDVPVVIFSMLSAAARAAEAGARAFLRKPLIESLFVATVQDVIAAHSSGTVEHQWASN